MTWQPLHPVHSIQNVTAAIHFAEALTDVTWRKVVRDAQSKATALGLTDRNAVNAVQFTMGPGGIVSNTPAGVFQPQPVESVRFMRSEIEEGTNLRRIAETLVVGKTELVFQTVAYTRWHAFAERLGKLLSVPLATALNAAHVINIRLEYRDAFRFEGDGPALAASLLKADSDLIAPHVFSRPELWHSHTGFFEHAETADQRLIQINIDASLDLDTPEGARIVGIATAVQDSFVPLIDDSNDIGSVTSEAVLGKFEPMHMRSVELFKSMVSAEIAERVGLS